MWERQFWAGSRNQSLRFAVSWLLWPATSMSEWRSLLTSQEEHNPPGLSRSLLLFHQHFHCSSTPRLLSLRVLQFTAAMTVQGRVDFSFSKIQPASDYPACTATEPEFCPSSIQDATNSQSLISLYFVLYVDYANIQHWFNLNFYQWTALKIRL